MNPVARYNPSTNFNPGCTDLMTTAERELSAFFNAVTELFGSEQAQLSAEDWLHELIEIDDLPIDLSGDGCLSEALANALGHLARPGALRDLFGRSIRQTQS